MIGLVGTRNQQRRAAKAKQRRKQARAQETARTRLEGEDWTASSPYDQALAVVEEALDEVAATDREVDPSAAVVGAVARLHQRPGFARHVDQAFSDVVQTQIQSVWARGWQPRDVVGTISRMGASAAVLAMAGDAMAADIAEHAAATVDDRFHEQLADIDARAERWPRADLIADLAKRSSGRPVDAIADLLCLATRLCWLPAIPVLCPPPGQARPGHPARAGDTRLLERVRGLLAKAESTPHEAEAEALTAKAQELMTRHSIDQALLASSADPQEPGGVRLAMDNPYAGEKFLLLNQVAKANRCQAVWSSEMGFATVLGFPADLRAVEILYTSLRMQATQAMLKAGSRPLYGGGHRTTSFRRSFQRSFAARIGERLADTDSSIVRDSQASHDNLLPVLAGRAQQVKQYSSRIFPNLVHKSMPGTWDPEGWALGRHAADLAPLTDLPSVGTASTGAAGSGGTGMASSGWSLGLGAALGSGDVQDELPL